MKHYYEKTGMSPSPQAVKRTRPAVMRTITTSEKRNTYPSHTTTHSSASSWSDQPVVGMSCTDSDGGRNPHQKGYVLWKNTAYNFSQRYDDRTAGKGIIEYGCQGDSVRADYIACDRAANGVCAGEEPPRCDNVPKSTCEGDNTLVLYDCKNGAVSTETRRCDDKCDNGRCVDGDGKAVAPVACPAVVCEPLSEGCFYEAKKDANGCPTCGTIVCNDAPVACPAVVCAAPPAGCAYQPSTDASGCQTCGTLVCEDDDLSEQYACQKSDGSTASSKNYTVQGTLTAPGTSGKKDYCTGQGNLVEYYCDQHQDKWEEHECEHACVDGACTSEPVEILKPDVKVSALRFEPTGTLYDTAMTNLLKADVCNIGAEDFNYRQTLRVAVNGQTSDAAVLPNTIKAGTCEEAVLPVIDQLLGLTESGSYEFTVTADATDVVAEGDETNNALSQTLSVQLYVAEPTLTAAHASNQPPFVLSSAGSQEMYRFTITGDDALEATLDTLEIELTVAGLQKVGSNSFVGSDFSLHPVKADGTTDASQSAATISVVNPSAGIARIKAVFQNQTLTAQEVRTYALFVPGFEEDADQMPDDNMFAIRLLPGEMIETDSAVHTIRP